MSDTESSSGGDFSGGSEDDWQPTQESAEDESDYETNTQSSPSSPEKKRSQSSTAKKKQVAPVPGTTRPAKVMSGAIRELLEKAKANQREKLDLSKEAGSSKDIMVSMSAKPTTYKRMPAAKANLSEGDDSSSSGDENLVNPSKLDLGSSFFEPAATKEDRIPTPNFDCNIGVGTLSDSGEDDDDVDRESEEEAENKPVVDVMENLKTFAQTLDNARENLKRYEEKARAETAQPDTDVRQLLALGEASAEPVPTSTKASSKKQTRKRHDSEDSDWEEVEDVQLSQPKPPPENVQVLLDVPDRRRAKISEDLEVALKRQLNKEKRDQQLLVHQSGFTEWLEQGNYINGILNDTALFQMALKLLPSAQAYPKDKADLKYFEAIAKWYKGAMKVPPDAEMYPPMADDLDMKASLRKQIESKSVKSKRDLILIFIILIRGIGLQCRMVVNLVVPPIRPPQSELCRITTKPKAETSINKRKTKANANDDDYDEIAEQLSSAKKKPAPKSSVKTEPNSASKKADSKVVASSAKTAKPTSTARSRTEPARKANAREPKTTLKVEATAMSPVRPRVTRSRTPALLIPQVDGLDDVIASPIAKRTRLRAQPTANPPMLRKLLIAQPSVDSPIKTRRNASRNNAAMSSLQVPKPHTLRVKKEHSISQCSSELFAVDPAERKTVTKPRKSPSRPAVKTKSSTVAATDSDAPPIKLTRLSDDVKIDRRVLSTDDEAQPATKPAASRTDFWPEVWSEKEEKWMCVDLFKGKVDSCETVIRGATVPVAYVLAWSNSCTVKDVSLRYCPQWHSVNRKMRADQEFVEQALKPFVGPDPQRDKKEDAEMQRLIMERPMPTSIGEFKNHPMYALKRHLLKFEAIYPPDPLTLGFVRGEAVYARECVHTLHSRELWVKQARVVKPGQTPYKIVTARPKWERATNTVIKDQPLELFGHWQTSEYEPPVAENGVVPKNAYGNVELFKACMLPINTVHLPYPGLNKVCKRLGIDYAPAMIGFDYHSGNSHPVYEGYVVCEEFAELVTDEWVKDTEAAEKKEAEKFQERIYGNWKRLIKGLLIRKRLQLRYNFEDKEEQELQSV